MTVTTRLLCAIDAAYPGRLAVEAAVEMAQLLGVPLAFLTINPVSQEGSSETQFWDDRIIAAVDVHLSNVLADAAAIARRSGLSDFDCVVASGINIAPLPLSITPNKGDSITSSLDLAGRPHLLAPRTVLLPPKSPRLPGVP